MLLYVDTQINTNKFKNEKLLQIRLTDGWMGFYTKYPGSAENLEGKRAPLNWGSLNALIHINSGITGVSILGGDNDSSDIPSLFYHVKKMGLFTVWEPTTPSAVHDANLIYTDFVIIRTNEDRPTTVYAVEIYKVDHDNKDQLVRLFP